MDDSVAGWIQGSFYDMLNHSCNIRSDLAWFDYSSVACCNSTDQGADGELDWEVVGTATMSVCLFHIEPD